MRRAKRRARQRGGAHDEAVPPASRVSRPALNRGQRRLPVHAAGIARHGILLNVYHIMQVAELAPLFPIKIEDR
jgi:hypothetical protein